MTLQLLPSTLCDPSPTLKYASYRSRDMIPWVTRCLLPETTEPTKTKVLTTLIRSQKKKGHIVHSLTPALTLILTPTLNHIAQKPQETTSTLFGLMYPTTAQRTIRNGQISGCDTGTTYDPTKWTSNDVRWYRFFCTFPVGWRMLVQLLLVSFRLCNCYLNTILLVATKVFLFLWHHGLKLQGLLKITWIVSLHVVASHYSQSPELCPPSTTHTT